MATTSITAAMSRFVAVTPIYYIATYTDITTSTASFDAAQNSKFSLNQLLPSSTSISTFGVGSYSGYVGMHFGKNNSCSLAG